MVVASLLRFYICYFTFFGFDYPDYAELRRAGLTTQSFVGAGLSTKVSTVQGFEIWNLDFGSVGARAVLPSGESEGCGRGGIKNEK